MSIAIYLFVVYSLIKCYKFFLLILSNNKNGNTIINIILFNWNFFFMKYNRITVTSFKRTYYKSVLTFIWRDELAYYSLSSLQHCVRLVTCSYGLLLSAEPSSHTIMDQQEAILLFSLSFITKFIYTLFIALMHSEQSTHLKRIFLDVDLI